MGTTPLLQEEEAMPIALTPMCGLSQLWWVDLTRGFQWELCPWAGHVCFGSQLDTYGTERLDQSSETCLCIGASREAYGQSKSPERSEGGGGGAPRNCNVRPAVNLVVNLALLGVKLPF